MPTTYERQHQFSKLCLETPLFVQAPIVTSSGFDVVDTIGSVKISACPTRYFCYQNLLSTLDYYGMEVRQ